MKSFKKFVEDAEEMNTIISSLEDNLGINPEDLKKEPQIASFFKFNQGTNLGSYKIISFKKNSKGQITHAVVKPLDSDKLYKDKKGSYVKIPKKEIDNSLKLINIKDLNKLLSQDFDQNQQQSL